MDKAGVFLGIRRWPIVILGVDEIYRKRKRKSQRQAIGHNRMERGS